MAGVLKFFSLSVLLIPLTFLYRGWAATSHDSTFGEQKANSSAVQETQQEVYCESPAYKARILSYHPLIIHLQDFITPRERTRLLEMRYLTWHVHQIGIADVYSEGRFEGSQIQTDRDDYMASPTRSSTTAYLQDYDPIVNCLSKRVSEFQGYHPEQDMESFQVTHYVTGQSYGAHHDWFFDEHNPHKDGANRLTTMFGILEAECENCGTMFPLIQVNWTQENPKWCDIVECGEEQLTVKPIPGSVLFWRNFLPDGKGDLHTLHAGLPLSSGIKVGVNIWSSTPGADPRWYSRNPVLDENTGTILR